MQRSVLQNKTKNKTRTHTKSSTQASKCTKFVECDTNNIPTGCYKVRPFLLNCMNAFSSKFENAWQFQMGRLKHAQFGCG